MEDIQLLDNPNKEENELKINELTKMYLTTIYKWTKFLAIVGFVFIGIMAIFGLFAIVVGSSMHYGYGLSGMLGLIYFIMAGIFLPLAIFMNNFSGNLKNAVEYTNNNELQTAFQNLKSYFKYSGILTIVIISIYLVFIVAVIAAMVTGFFAF